MIKKNQDGQNDLDGLSPSAKNLILFGTIAGAGFENPGMQMVTASKMLKSVKLQVEDLAGRPSHSVRILTDSLRLLEALAIKYGDTPIVDVVDRLIDEAYELHEEATADSVK